MTDQLLCGARSETYKGAVHLALGMIGGVCFAYNTGAAVVAPTPRLVLQAIFYGLLTGHEICQVYDHWHT